MLSDPGYTLFDTVIGQCGIVWSNSIVLGTLLPERDTNATRTRLSARFPALSETSPPPRIESIPTASPPRTLCGCVDDFTHREVV